MNKVRSSIEIEGTKEYQTEVMELKNTITELKYLLMGFNSRLCETEEWISGLENKATKPAQTAAKRKEIFKMCRWSKGLMGQHQVE